MEFKLSSSYQPTGDQPSAIKQLVEGLNKKSAYLFGDGAFFWFNV